MEQPISCRVELSPVFVVDVVVVYPPTDEYEVGTVHEQQWMCTANSHSEVVSAVEEMFSDGTIVKINIEVMFFQMRPNGVFVCKMD